MNNGHVLKKVIFLLLGGSLVWLNGYYLGKRSGAKDTYKEVVDEIISVTDKKEEEVNE